MSVIDGGPWRGPSSTEWVERINEGACRVAHTEEDQCLSGGRWVTPWIGEPDPCYGIHNFITDEGGDDIDGPAHCTDCGAQRLDIQR